MEDLIDENDHNELDKDCATDDTIYLVRDYSNSRYVEYNRGSEYSEVSCLVKYLVEDMGKKTSSGYRNNMKVIILDLYHCYLSDREQYIGYHRGNNHYKFKLKVGKEDRYIKNPHISRDHFIGCVDYLIEKGYVENKPGGHFYNEITKTYYGYLSRIRATWKLVALWEDYKLSPIMIGRFSEEEVIVLKGVPVIKDIDGKKKKVKYEVQYVDDNETKRMRRIVQEYNNFLSRCHIDIDVECMTDEDREEFAENLIERKNMKYEKVRLADKKVRRIFNNNNFKQGGRFYDAFWIGCPSLLRKYITINGSNTVELDYSGIHIQLLYALKGINYAEMGEDPYSLVDNDPERELNKVILLTALNAEGEKPTAKSIFNELRKDKSLEKYNIKNHKPIIEKLKKLKEKHPLIAEFIAEGYGIKLQYYDSCIIEKLIEYSISHGIPILTIHDSVICPEGYADFIRDKMWQYYRDFTAQKFNIDIKYKSIQPNARPFFKRQLLISKYKVPRHNTISTMGSVIGINLEKYKYHYGMYGKNTIIKVKEGARTGACNNKCNHSKRIELFKRRSYVFLRNVTIKLIVDNENKRDLIIY